MLDHLPRARWVFHVQVCQITETGGLCNFRLDESHVLREGIVEIGNRAVQIVLQVLRSRGLVKTVDCAAPEGEASPIELAGGKHFVVGRGREFGVKALERGAVALVIRPFDLLDNPNRRVARRAGSGFAFALSLSARKGTESE